MPRFSIIIPCYNQLELTAACIKSIERNSHTKDIELIIIDDGSNDGSTGYLSELSFKSWIRVIGHKTRKGFTVSCNDGMKEAQSDYIVLLNNDTLVTPHWLKHLEDALLTAPKKLLVDNVALVGPMSNKAWSLQHVNVKVEPERVDSFGAEFYQLNKGKMRLAQFISGFCLMFKRAVYDQIGGFDPRFSPGGYEDNDFCLRAREKGFLGVIAQDTFIYHHGSSTVRDLKYDVHSKRWQYYEKYKKEDRKKLVITYYLRGNKLSNEVLEKAESVADEVILSSKNIISPRKPNEAKQREQILLEGKSQTPDWILSLEGNMVLEDKFTREYAEKLMNPVMPDIMGYEFNVFNVSDKDPNLVIGEPRRMTLMFRNLENQHIRTRHPQGFNAPIAPFVPDNAKRLCPIRIKRLVPMDRVGGEIKRWQEKSDIALVTIMRDEKQYLDSFFEPIHQVFDEIVLVDTGSSDNSKELAEKWGAKVYDFQWRDHFAVARDFALGKTDCEFTLQLDIDERIENISKIHKMVNTDSDAFLFTIIDLLPGGKVSYPESVRLFRNKRGIHYSGVIHETTIDSMSKIPDLRVARATTKIIHEGRLRPGRDQRQGYYEHLANKQMKKDPESSFAYYHLALIERDRLNMEKALSLIREAAERGFEKPNVRLELANIHLQCAYIVYKTLRELDPQHPYYGWVQERLAILKKFFPNL